MTLGQHDSTINVVMTIIIIIIIIITNHGPVPVSVTSRCSIETAERIELVFGM